MSPTLRELGTLEKLNGSIQVLPRKALVSAKVESDNPFVSDFYECGVRAIGIILFPQAYRFERFYVGSPNLLPLRYRSPSLYLSDASYLRINTHLRFHILRGENDLR